jgi:hypothetical protein
MVTGANKVSYNTTGTAPASGNAAGDLYIYY